MLYRFSAVFVLLPSLLFSPVQAQSTAASDSSTTTYLPLVEVAWQHVNDTYLDKDFNNVDWLAVFQEKASTPYSTPEDAHTAIEDMLDRLGDPALRFLEAEELAALLQDLSGAASPGLGLTELLSVDIDERTRRLTVITPRPNTPASRAGLRPFDIIASIDGVPTDGLPLHEATALLRGAAQTPVTLAIERATDAFEITLRREALPTLSPVVESMYKEEHGTRIGYVGLLQFTAEATDEMRGALTALLDQQVDGLVLDLRNNPGGLVAQSTAIASLFLMPDTPIGAMVGRGGSRTELLATEPPLTDKPLVVLVNAGTASAAEVLAGALQANGRALIIGTSTFGKGLVHAPQFLSDGSALLMPSSRLHTPTGRDILTEGISPDVVVAASSSPILNPERIAPASSGDLVYLRAVAALKAQLAAR